MKRYLNLSGDRSLASTTSPGFSGPDWEQSSLRLEGATDVVDPKSLLDMKEIADGELDAVLSVHNLQFLTANEIESVLKEFNRVLKRSGFAIIACPNLEVICALILDGKITETLYESERGPVAPIDMLFGYRPFNIDSNEHFMAHRCGLTQDLLRATLRNAAGFATVATVGKDTPPFNIWAVASKGIKSDEEMRELAKDYFPADKKIDPE